MKKHTLYLSALFMVLCLMAGCSFLNEPEDDMELTQEDIQMAENSEMPAVSGSGVSGIQTLSVYTVDGINEQLVPLKVPVDSDTRVTPAFIINEVVANLEEKIEVTEIEEEKSRIYITFDSEYAPIKKCSKKFETMILDCISNSILDNISYINEVVFRAGDGAYRSDNFAFGEDEVYSSR
ncbi:MAG: hypothetical protein NC293_05475 [Roseburia sp.]|nr:hypothetical protein [Roseburia sp.]